MDVVDVEERMEEEEVAAKRDKSILLKTVNTLYCEASLSPETAAINLYDPAVTSTLGDVQFPT